MRSTYRPERPPPTVGSRKRGLRRLVARLGRDLLDFLREHAADVDDQPELVRYLNDGTLERHLRLIEQRRTCRAETRAAPRRPIARR
jgi:hypothetical protein